VLLWVTRGFVAEELTKFRGGWIQEKIFDCQTNNDTNGNALACFKNTAVSRLSFGYSFFHLLLTLLFLRSDDKQSAWQEDLHFYYWWLKIPILVVFLGVSFFFLPRPFLDIFYYFAATGGAVFLLVQIILLVDFSYTWHETWASYETRTWNILIWVTTVIFYLISIAVAVISYFYLLETAWFRNVIVLTETIVSCLVVSLISLHPKIERGSLLISSVLTLYCLLIIASAMAGSTTRASTTLIENYIYIVAMASLSSMIAVFYSSLYYFSAHRYLYTPEGNSSGYLRVTIATEDGGSFSEEPLLETNRSPYSLYKFHFVFAFGGLYLGMVFTNWETTKEAMDISYDNNLAYWIKFAVQVTTVVLYAWSLLAPLFIERLNTRRDGSVVFAHEQNARFNSSGRRR